MRNSLFLTVFALLLCCFGHKVIAQVTVNGVVLDENGSPMVGSSVILEGTLTGTNTDFDGKFSLTVDVEPPFVLVISFLGYDKLLYTVTDPKQNIRVRLEPQQTMLQELEIVDDRLTDKQKESPTTVESMDLIAIKETPAANFYDGLGSLKGVDLTAASMGFKIVNTRGFNSTSPVRSLQLIDGVDNQAPGLNFSIGNFAGASELDVQRVELIVGANSALYGPNAFNGVISMTTKDPFIHQGVSVMRKWGERNLREGALRMAGATKIFGKEYENLAAKINISYMEALDWEADNYDAVYETESHVGNWGGYNAVNRYGDENVSGNTDLSNQRLFPGLNLYHRTGYNEIDLVDYNTNNLKLSGSLHYKLTEDIEAKYKYSYGNGTTVYQGDNRYSLKDLQIHQHVVEIGKKDKFFIRAYRTSESAGKSYDAVFTAVLMQQSAKPDPRWSQDYITYWNNNIIDRVKALPNFPEDIDYFNMPLGTGPNLETYELARQVMQHYADSMILWHNETREFADGKGSGIGPTEPSPYYAPGTNEFDSAFASVTSKLTFGEGGSGFFDESALNHVQGEYKFEPSFMDIRLGGSYRLYQPDSKGTIFLDTGDVKITNSEVGFYTGLEKRVMDERLILSATGRVDKNENFDAVFSPAASAVYLAGEKSTFRLSFSSAIRNPTLQDQFLFYNVGRAILVGNLNGWDSLVTAESLTDYFRSDFNRDTLDYFNIDPVKPEKVRTIEVGYKGTLMNNLFVDASYYYSWYQDFLGFQLGAQIGFDSLTGRVTETQFYRVSANSSNQVTTQGFSIGMNYYFKKKYMLSGNYSWNVLNKVFEDDPIIPAYNTPEHKFNITFSGRDLRIQFRDLDFRNVGFNINYKWIQGFLFEGSPQFTGEIPTYDVVDAQVSYNAKRLYSTFKLGASNVLNRKNFHTYGGPRVGRLAYFSVLVELDRKR